MKTTYPELPTPTAFHVQDYPHDKHKAQLAKWHKISGWYESVVVSFLSIPMCACFRSENFLVTRYKLPNKKVSHHT